MGRSVYIKTFGCQMNEYDSEKVIRLLAPTHSPAESIDDADLVVINTCSVREKGEHKLFSMLGELRDRKKQQPGLRIGVMGCVAQQEGEAIAKRNDAVDFIVGTHNLSLIPSLLDAVDAGRGRQVAVDYRDEWEELPLDSGASADSSAGASWLPGSVRALVSIQRGCDKNCSYCVVPTTRGREVSRSPEEIVREVTLKARLGAKEVLLLGQTVNSYGKDLSPRRTFEDLIRQVAAVPGVERIRFTSPHPAEVRTRFLDLYREVPQLAPHIHLPVQSGSDRILRLMNRNYRRARYLEIVDSLRERLPEIAISTDIIVGFPTETEAEFEETLDLVRQVRYHSAFCFKYSRRPNTTAGELFGSAEEVPEAVSGRRLETLLRLQNIISAEVNARQVGTVVQVLIEEVRAVDRDYGRAVGWGRIGQNTSVEVLAPANSERSGASGTQERGALLSPGVLVSVAVNHASAHGLRGELCSDSGGELRPGSESRFSVTAAGPEMGDSR